MTKVQRRVTMYHESLVTKTNLTGAKTYNEGDEPSMENGWSNRPIPAKPAVEIEVPQTIDMKSELETAYNKGVTDTEGKIEEAMRLGRAQSDTEYKETIETLMSENAILKESLSKSGKKRKGK